MDAILVTNTELIAAMEAVGNSFNRRALMRFNDSVS
jgi:hypothetical protein